MKEKIKEILANQLRVEAASISDEASILDDLGADSLDVVEMLMAIEEEFGVNVPDEDVAGLKTIKDVADYVEKNKA